MSGERWFAATLIVSFAVAQYGLAALALRELIRRAPVSGENNVLWGLIVLAVPIAGPLWYAHHRSIDLLPDFRSPASSRSRERDRCEPELTRAPRPNPEDSQK